MQEQLRCVKAAEVAQAAQLMPYVDFVECRIDKIGTEVVIFDVEVECGQRVAHDIRRTERIAASFDIHDRVMPEVLALRADFPPVPHLNLQPTEFPRSLCISEEPYDELKLHWTGRSFIENIRQWLALTAKGMLHADDQPLEPLLPFARTNLIIPNTFLAKNIGLELLIVEEPIDGGHGMQTFIAKQEIHPNSRLKTPYIALIFSIQPLTHGILYKAPQNLSELNQFLKQVDIDLLKFLRTRLESWHGKSGNRFLSANLILVINLPKKRKKESEYPETIEQRVFLIPQGLKTVGIEIGLWAWQDGEIGRCVPIDDQKDGSNLPITLMNPVPSFSKEWAQKLNGFSNKTEPKIAAVGVGTLGSQIFMNLVRAGYGTWTLIDNDLLYPHNLARHALTADSIGYPKATQLAHTANRLIGDEDEPIATGLVENILGLDPEKMEEMALEADVFLDMSASVAVARHLAQSVGSATRCISLFLNPQGTDLVILAEEQNRSVRLDSLEMQYYRFLIHHENFKNHLQRDQYRIRYAASCRDLSVTIPQDFVSLHAAVGSRTLREVIENPTARISLWQIDPKGMEMKSYHCDIHPTIQYYFGEWRLLTDQFLIDKIHNTRKEKLPNETGGVLIGSYDTSQKIVYIVDILKSPSDSIEQPTLYRRGCRGIKKALKKIGKITTDQIEYLGEWHSHPDGHDYAPSANDKKVFEWLSDEMKVQGLPTLMLIVGGEGQYQFYLNEIND